MDVVKMAEVVVVQPVAFAFQQHWDCRWEDWACRHSWSEAVGEAEKLGHVAGQGSE